MHMVVAGLNPEGYPDLLPVRVKCTQAAIEATDHYALAEEVASGLHWEPCLAYEADKFKAAAQQLDWLDVTLTDYTKIER